MNPEQPQDRNLSKDLLTGSNRKRHDQDLGRVATPDQNRILRIRTMS